MKNEIVLSYKEQLLEFAPDITHYNNIFRTLNKRWNSAITVGMIEAGMMKSDTAKLFGPLLEDMRHTKELYGQTQEQLVDAVLVEMSKKIVSQLFDAAKFTINILKRNLFERTADVGYLATDSEIVNFLKQSAGQLSDEERSTGRKFIQDRLGHYQYEYTVYNEILIVDVQGNIAANLDMNNRTTRTNDPLLNQTLAIDPGNADPYLEIYRKTDLCPGRGKVLIYSQAINDPDTGSPLGILCLCFDFKDEVERIFKDLSHGNTRIISGVLDGSGQVMASSHGSFLPVDSKIKIDTTADFQLLNMNGKTCLVTTVPTDGYQGFYGLTWYGMAMIPTQEAYKSNGQEDIQLNQDTLQNLEHFSGDLAFLQKKSNDLLGAMKIDSINGQVQAAKFRANAFVKVLHFVKEIGEDINGLFSNAIENLQRTVATSLFSDVEFRAFQGNNIADRNLYERANDVCWWALTPLFRSLLSKNVREGLTDEDRNALRENLQYINNLYTPYLRLVLANSQGEIVAVSDPPEELEEVLTEENIPKGQEFVGTQIDRELLNKALSLASSKDYCVSDFTATPLYGGRHTYIYSTAVRAPEDTRRSVGVIQIVFDAEPQFSAMLSDVLPRDENNAVLSGSFALFLDRKKQVIAATIPDYPPGSLVPFEDRLFRYAPGERDSIIMRINDRSFALGLQVSEGYREYKTADKYNNDVICMIFVPL
jgi:hypothetical protein